MTSADARCGWVGWRCPGLPPVPVLLVAALLLQGVPLSHAAPPVAVPAAAPGASAAAPQAVPVASPQAVAPAGAGSPSSPMVVEFSAQVRRTHPKQPERNASGIMNVSRWGIRTEGTVDNRKVQFIFLPERKTVLVLFPDQQAYMEHTGVDKGRPLLPDDAASPCRTNPAVSCRNLGAVSWNGRQPVRWEITEKDADNKVQRTYLYVDQRLQAAIREEYPDGTIQEFVTIQEGPQPQHLFALPAGYTKLTPAATAPQQPR